MARPRLYLDEDSMRGALAQGLRTQGFDVCEGRSLRASHLFRIYMDEDSADREIVAALRGVAFDVLTTGESGHLALDDEAQLAFATESGRAVVTANRKDFARLHARWKRTGRRHSGIIVRTRQSLTIGEQLRAIEAISGRFGSQESTTASST